MKKVVSCIFIGFLCFICAAYVNVANASSNIEVRLELKYEPNPYDEPNVECYGIIKAYKDGAVIWKHQTETAIVGEWNTITDVYTNNNNAYIVVDHILYAFDMETGVVKWKINDMGTDNCLEFDRYGNIYISSYMGPNDVTVVSKTGEKLYVKSEEYSWVTDLELMDNVLRVHYYAPEEGYDYINISQFKPVTVELDGKKIEFDQDPVIIRGRTLVPVRAVVEAMNGKVEWDDTTKTATLMLNNTVIKLTAGSNVAYLNGNAQMLDVAPQIMNSRTILPIRFVAENFGYNVNWNAEHKIVEIVPKSDSSAQINFELLNCIGKTKKEIVNSYGYIVDSSYWLGGKYYTHQNLSSELYYISTGEYDDTKNDDVEDSAICGHIIADISELLNTPGKNYYTISELESIFGKYEFTNDLDSDFYPMCMYEFFVGDYKLTVQSESLNPTVSEINVFKSN